MLSYKLGWLVIRILFLYKTLFLQRKIGPKKGRGKPIRCDILLEVLQETKKCTFYDFLMDMFRNFYGSHVLGMTFRLAVVTFTIFSSLF